jgi:phosphoribosylaminoimidazole carboxylase
MMAEAASCLGIDISVLDPSDEPPARNIARHVKGDFRDAKAIADFVKDIDILTFEIEHINVDAVEEAIKSSGRAIKVHPSPSTIRIIQDKFLQKKHFEKFGVHMAEFSEGTTVDQVKKAGASFGYPLMLKSKTLAYDGRGNCVVADENEIEDAIKKLGGGIATGGPDLYVEKMVPFWKEIAVMVAKSQSGEIKSYSAVETIQTDSICRIVRAPLNEIVSDHVSVRAVKLAEKAVRSLDGAGIFGVEMFLLKNGEILLNEVAPRPHNSGHYTIEACYTSQFEQHLRCILGMSLGDCHMKVGGSLMINILGKDEMEETKSLTSLALDVPGASLHWYKKTENRLKRKMAHVTVCDDSLLACEYKCRKFLEEAGINLHQLSVKPLVGIIMGSDSDLPVMKAAAETLELFGIPFEVTIVSAHRTPERMLEYGRGAEKRGLKVIIAGAGGAAHLPGMVASLTTLPVIGVPVALKHLDGMDSLYSIVQMPRGVPVATVAINNSTNAGLLAARIIGVKESTIRHRMSAYQEKMTDSVMQKVDNLSSSGWKNYVTK